MPSVLFLCSGNYYRSRFAEIFFNWLAAQEKIAWRAKSRGFRLSTGNVGPISDHAINGLQARGVPHPDEHRFPLAVEGQDFETFDLIVAVKEAEHRPKMLARFPIWADRIDYWHIHDLDCAEPDEALVELEAKVRELVERLRVR